MKIKNLIFLISLSIIGLSVFAQIPTQPPGQAIPGIQVPIVGNIFGCQPTQSFFECAAQIAADILRIFFAFVIVMAVIMYISAGYGYITKGSDPDSQKKVKDRLIYGTLGLLIAFLSWSLVIFLTNFAQRGLIS